MYPQPHRGRVFGRPVTVALKIVLFFFAFLLTEAASAQTVYVTRTGAKYHADACRYLRQSKIETTLKQAVADGYTACSVCKPSAARTNSTQQNVVRPQSTTPRSTAQPKTTSRQCSGITKAGARCKRMTTSANGRCYQH